MPTSSPLDARIATLAQTLGVHLDAAAVGALARFAEAVRAWAARTDLTSARTPEALVEVLFLDALVLAGVDLVPQGARLVDVGAGAGAPALPLAVLRSDTDVTLVEPRRRRVVFLRSAIGQLALQARARVVEARVTPSHPDVPGAPFDLVVSRATFAPERWLPMGAALASRVAVLTAQPLPPMQGFEAVAQRDYGVPSSGAPRTVTVFRPVPATHAARALE